MVIQTEVQRLDRVLEGRGLSAEVRDTIWNSAASILEHGPTEDAAASRTIGLALGYVQSGKTTAIAALMAAAADRGFRVVVAVLGSTRILLSQNEGRLRESFGLNERDDYVWVHLSNPSGKGAARSIRDAVDRGRVVLITTLKHPTRIDRTSQALRDAGAGPLKALIVDDEADQASLNTQINDGAESRTYVALSRLRESFDRHLFVQFTATPYAPLLLQPDDHLLPEFVEMLEPGPGYTGGREFFVDAADTVVRPIPSLDEQPGKTLPAELPGSLKTAFANFIVGTALLLAEDRSNSPVSMLIHSTQRNDVQERYFYLLDRLHRRWRQVVADAQSLEEFPPEMLAERAELVKRGATDKNDSVFHESVNFVLRECTLWLVNSASAVNEVDWSVSPVHVLLGGSKLDRGFTVEGLTVTYMNRAPSAQIDTLEQRSRAFGYRNEYLPYCQFFATPGTLQLLRDIVDTEYDLRARLQDWISEGQPVSQWAREVGLLLPAGASPTRPNVISALSSFNDRIRWHQLRRPPLGKSARSRNDEIVETSGLLSASPVHYGRLSHPTLIMPLHQVIEAFLVPWADGGRGYSPGWRHKDLIDLLRRHPRQDASATVILMRHPNGGPREREWREDVGFVNLLQGPDADASKDLSYPGDRNVGGVTEDPARVVVQVHYVSALRDQDIPPIFTLAVHPGRQQVVRRS